MYLKFFQFRNPCHTRIYDIYCSTRAEGESRVMDEKEAYQKFVGNGNRLSLKVQESFGSLKNECRIESNIFLVRGVISQAQLILTYHNVRFQIKLLKQAYIFHFQRDLCGFILSVQACSHAGVGLQQPLQLSTCKCCVCIYITFQKYLLARGHGRATPSQSTDDNRQVITVMSADLIFIYMIIIDILQQSGYNITGHF